MKKQSLLTLLAIVFSAPLAAQNPVPAVAVEKGGPLPRAAKSAIERMIANGTPGVTVIVAKKGKELSRVHVGAVDKTTQYPIASASKWLTAATVMALVDEGKLSLDAPVSTWLPGIKNAEKVTLRQSLAQTTGTAGGMGELYDLKQDAQITLRQSAEEILTRPFEQTPGNAFKYGGPGFQIAGAVVEAATGQRWEEVFQSRIGRPLKMNKTYWMHLTLNPAEQVPATETLNPVLQGGAVSTADDYIRFMHMIATDGRSEGKRLLSRNAIAALHSDQTINASRTTDKMLGDAHYSLGNWCETWNAKARCTRSSSLGAFGVYPWIDWHSGVYGIIFLKGNLDKVWPDIRITTDSLISAHR